MSSSNTLDFFTEGGVGATICGTDPILPAPPARDGVADLSLNAGVIPSKSATIREDALVSVAKGGSLVEEAAVAAAVTCNAGALIAAMTAPVTEATLAVGCEGSTLATAGGIAGVAESGGSSSVGKDSAASAAAPIAAEEPRPDEGVNWGHEDALASERLVDATGIPTSRADTDPADNAGTTAALSPSSLPKTPKVNASAGPQVGVVGFVLTVAGGEEGAEGGGKTGEYRPAPEGVSAASAAASRVASSAAFAATSAAVAAAAESIAADADVIITII